MSLLVQLAELFAQRDEPDAGTNELKVSWTELFRTSTGRRLSPSRHFPESMELLVECVMFSVETASE
jgi:hypothetical protein